jgi:hypothetical protein
VYKRRRENDGAYDSNRALRIMGGYVEGMTDATTEDEELKLRGELRGLDDALRELADQRRILLEHLSIVEAASRTGAGLRMAAENARAREAREANLLAKRGDRWTAVNAVRERCPELVRRCRSNFRTAKHVALFGPDAWFLSRDDGAYAWENAPEDVRDVERGLEPGDALEYVAVGPEGQRFVRSRAGFVWYGGTRSSRFVAAARDPDRTIRRVAFGVDDAWIILFDDGRWMSQGVPARMCDFIHENETSPGGGGARGRPRDVVREVRGRRGGLFAAETLRGGGWGARRGGVPRQERRAGGGEHALRVVREVRIGIGARQRDRTGVPARRRRRSHMKAFPGTGR